MGYPKDIDEYTDAQLLTELASRAHDRFYGRCDYCHRFSDESSCKFPRRHMLAISVKASLLPVEDLPNGGA